MPVEHPQEYWSRHTGSVHICCTGSGGGSGGADETQRAARRARVAQLGKGSFRQPRRLLSLRPRKNLM